MDSGFLFLRDIVVVLLIGFIAGFLAKKFRLPLLLGYLLGGFLFALFTTNQFTFGPQIQTLSDIGVSLLLFTIGIEFSLKRLAQVKHIAIFGTFFQILFMVLLALVVLPLFGFTLAESIFLGSIVALSSTAVVVKVLTEKNQVETVYGQVSLGMLLIQDLAVIPLLLLLPLVLAPNTGFGSTFSLVLLSLGKAGGLIFITLYAGKNFIPTLIQQVAKVNSRELLLLIVVIIALGFSYLAQIFGLPSAIGAFLAGILISETTIHHAVFTEIRPLRDVFSIIFFVLLGMLISVSYFFSHIALILFFFIFITFAKSIIVYILVRLHTFHAKTGFLVAASLLSVGEFAFVIAGLFVVQGLISPDIYNLLLSTTLLTLLVSPWEMLFAPHLYGFLKRRLRPVHSIYNLVFGKTETDTRREKVLMTNHVILLGHGRTGKVIAATLQKEHIPFITIDFNLGVVEHLKQGGLASIYGDPSDIEIIKAANITDAKVLVITFPDAQTQEVIIRNTKKMNPKIPIISRSHTDSDAARLEATGAHIVIQPEIEAGKIIGERVIKLF